MKKYVKSFLLRGLVFGGFGTIIVGIVYLILNYIIKDFTLNGQEVFVGILSTYVLAFIHAGTSIFNQIDEWSPVRSCGSQLLSLYLAYTSCYLLNSWIPFKWEVLGIFTLIFVGSFLTIWISVYLIVIKYSNKLNAKLK